MGEVTLKKPVTFANDITAHPAPQVPSLWDEITSQSDAWRKLADTMNYMAQGTVWIDDRFVVDNNFNFAAREIENRRKYAAHAFALCVVLHA